MVKVYCLVCDREIEMDEHGCLDDAGFMYLEFHYGSRHDQCLGFHARHTLFKKDTRKDIILSSDRVEAYICDDCFEKKIDKIRGFRVIKKIISEEV